jgi:hypothetical protein
MEQGEKDALLAFLELNLLILIDAHATVGNIKNTSVDEILEDVYDILNDIEEVVSPTNLIS